MLPPPPIWLEEEKLEGTRGKEEVGVELTTKCWLIQYNFNNKVLQLNFNSTYSSQRNPKIDSYQSLQKTSISNNNNIYDVLYL